MQKEEGLDFKLTEEQQALREQFEAFFREEMKNAPTCYQTHSGLEAMYDTDEGFAFHRYMQKNLAAKGWLTMAWPKAYGGSDYHYEKVIRNLLAR